MNVEWQNATKQKAAQEPMWKNQEHRDQKESQINVVKRAHTSPVPDGQIIALLQHNVQLIHSWL